MARISLNLIALLLLATTAQAAPYTLTTTARQDKALQHMVTFYNQRNPDATITATQLLQQQVNDLFDAFEEHRAVEQKARLGSSYEAATPSVKQQIDDLLR